MKKFNIAVIFGGLQVLSELLYIFIFHEHVVMGTVGKGDRLDGPTWHKHAITDSRP